MSEILKANNIVKSYKMGQSTLQVLTGASLSIEKGQFVAIIGASGSGKSTLLHIFGALDRADNGTVEYHGSDINKFSSRRLNKYRNQTVGFIFQFYHLLDELTVLENTILPSMAQTSVLGWISRRKTAKKTAAELLERLGLAERIKHKPYQLSGGERQRVAIARALINRPELLLADEPTGNLDFETGNGILDILEEFSRDGQTIVMVTHDDRIAARAHRIVKLTDGKIA